MDLLRFSVCIRVARVSPRWRPLPCVALARDRDWGRMQALWAEMTARGVRPNVVTYWTLMDAYRRAGLWDKAIEACDGGARRNLFCHF